MSDYCKLARELKKIDARNGLDEELFLGISTLMPVPNVDLLILDDKGRILLSWRDDNIFETGWHIPGGCIRFKETMLERVQKTALSELNTKVEVNPVPVAIRDVIEDKYGTKKTVRAHHLAVMYECRLPKGYVIDNGELKESDSGYLKWFDKIPDNMLGLHKCYNDIFQERGLLKIN